MSVFQIKAPKPFYKDWLKVLIFLTPKPPLAIGEQTTFHPTKWYLNSSPTPHPTRNFSTIYFCEKLSSRSKPRNIFFFGSDFRWFAFVRLASQFKGLYDDLSYNFLVCICILANWWIVGMQSCLPSKEINQHHWSFGPMKLLLS